ncbi:hypothetical protein A0O34_00490 [Chryseobacterium glaciei]|uniref:Uncharacterized protein n=1 Tax=Chryseobacterium glaciei TaxID=1685010 RepID=A0A172XQE0_9FLAO|nr:hypothetical protein [Chryseobacterium glaciei]ANF49124.1 hypothetical protein A0O34_00490 [Chryseobacterium glaciei]
MKPVLEEAIFNAEDLLKFSYSENVEDVKIEVIRLTDTATIYINAILHHTSKKRNTGFKEVLYPYRADFKIIDAFTDKIDVGVSFLGKKLSIEQYRADADYKIIQEKLSVLESQLIPQLERKQENKKRKTIIILIMIFIFSILCLWIVFF